MKVYKVAFSELSIITPYPFQTHPGEESRRPFCTGSRTTSHLCNLFFTPSHFAPRPPHRHSTSGARPDTASPSLLSFQPFYSSVTATPRFSSHFLNSFLGPSSRKSLTVQAPGALRDFKQGMRLLRAHSGLSGRTTGLTRVPSDWLVLSDGIS